MVIYGEGVLRCSFSLSSKDLPNSPIYLSSQSSWVTPKPIGYPTFLGDLLFVIRALQEVPDGIASITMNQCSHFVTYLLESFAKTFGVRNNHGNVVVIGLMSIYDCTAPNVDAGLENV